MVFSLISIIASVSFLAIYNLTGVISQFDVDFLTSSLALQIRSSLGIAIEVFMFYFLMIDLYKWGIFVIAASDQSKYNYEEIYTKRKKFLMAFLFTALSSITLMFLVISVALIINSDDKDKELGDWWRKRLKDTIGIFFSIILATYVITLSMLIIRLKQRVPEFYQAQKKQLFIVSSLLIICMISKVTLRFIFYNKAFVSYWDTSRRQHTWFYPLFMFFSFYLEYFLVYLSVLLSMR